MKRPVILAATVLLLAILAALGSWWFSTPQVLKRKTESLLSTLTIDPGGGKIGLHASTYTLNALLAAEVALENPTLEEANGSFERSELESAFSWLCNQAKQTRFELQHFHAVTVTGTTAQVDCRLYALVELSTHRLADGRYDATFHWQKGEDRWRLTRANWAPTP